jgi:hypothetical protein
MVIALLSHETFLKGTGRSGLIRPRTVASKRPKQPDSCPLGSLRTRAISGAAD